MGVLVGVSVGVLVGVGVLVDGMVGVAVGADGITTMVTDVKADAVDGSVAVKLMTCGPTSPLLGVHEKVLCTGLAGAGIGKLAPAGRPIAARLTVSAGSGSLARTSKVRVLPAMTVKVVPSGGVGG